MDKIAANMWEQMKPISSRLLVVWLSVLLVLWASASAAQTRARTATPAETSVAQPGADYRLRKGDKLSIKFLYQPELSDASIVVRPDGKISLAMIEEVKAEGLTPKELRAVLEKAYREILLDPEITVTVIEFVAPRVFVGGQVAKPGSYDLRAGQTLLQAVILAGGFTAEAHQKYVLHARPSGERELKVVAVDVTKLLKTSGQKQEVMLQDGDYIYVPNSKLSKFTQIINAFRSLVPGYGIQF
jgi:polysaccharide export outer membrane protein